MPFAIDPVCGKAVNPDQSALQVTANGISFPFCGEECAAKFRRNRLDYLYCPWKPTQKVNPSVRAEIYGATVYFCCPGCKELALVRVAIQTNGFGFFGVAIKIDQARARKKLENFAVVTRVIRDSPAAKLGIVTGSVILRIDGKEMNDYRKVIRWMRLSKAGQEALFGIQNPDGKIAEIKVVLTSRRNRRGGLVY